PRGGREPRQSGRVRSEILVFFFQAEDGIRDRNVTGVQTCALPILSARSWQIPQDVGRVGAKIPGDNSRRPVHGQSAGLSACAKRSEERRVGKEGRSRWAADHEKKKERGERDVGMADTTVAGRRGGM